MDSRGVSARRQALRHKSLSDRVHCNHKGGKK